MQSYKDAVARNELHLHDVEHDQVNHFQLGHRQERHLPRQQSIASSHGSHHAK